MSPKLYGHHLSLCTRRVLLVLAEKGITFDFEVVDFLNGEHKRPSYAQKHPFAVIPFLEDGEFKIFESRAIARYLATKYQKEGTPLIPAVEDIHGSALFEQWASVEYSQFYGIADAVLTNKLFNPVKGIHVEESVTLESVKKLHDKLDVLDTVLAGQQYMGGETFSLIDIFYMPVVDLLFKAGEGPAFEGRSNLEAWWAKVSARDSWKHVNSV